MNYIGVGGERIIINFPPLSTINVNNTAYLPSIAFYRFFRTPYLLEYPECTCYPDLRTLKPNQTIYINMKIVETVAGNAVCLPKRANARPPARP